MTTCMSNTRIRITIDCEDAVKRAFLSRASIEGKTPQEFFEWMIKELCEDDLTRAKLAIDGIGEDDEPPPAKKRK